jgi:hypothetical protein
MTDIEGVLGPSLAARAGRVHVQAGELARGAMVKAGRMRARRRVAGLVATAVLVVGGAAGVRAALPERKDTTLPAALGVPSALSRPDGIGADPALLHFDLDLRAFEAAVGQRPAIVDWVSAEEHEAVTVYGADHAAIAAVHLAPSALDLKRAVPPPDVTAVASTVRGRSGKAYPLDGGTDLRWEPVDGIFVAVLARDQATAERVFAAVRLDRVQRCVTPMRLSALPAGASWTDCQTAVRIGQVPGRYEWERSALIIWQADAQRVRLWAVQRGTEQGGTFAPDRTVAGRPAQWLTDGMRGLWIPEFGPVGLYVLEGTPFHADLLGEETAAWYAEHLQVYEDLTNPDAWPTAATR